MLILLARIFSVLFTLLVAIKSYLDFRAKRESITMMVFWVATWVAISTIAFFPQLIDSFLGSPKTRAGVGTVLGIGLIFIYFVIYRVYVKADRLEKQLSKLIRESSLKNNDAKSMKRSSVSHSLAGKPVKKNGLG